MCPIFKVPFRPPGPQADPPPLGPRGLGREGEGDGLREEGAHDAGAGRHEEGEQR